MKKFLMVMVSSIVLFACKKEKDSTPGCPMTVNGLSGVYKLTALQYKSSASSAPSDYLAYLDDCEKDDLLILKNDGTYTEDDGSNVCVPAETVSGTWELHGKTLVSDGKLNGTILSFDCKSLVFYIDNAIKPGDRLTYTIEKQ